METVLEYFEANMELAFGDFVIRTKNVKYLARERSVTFHPLFYLEVQHGKIVVLNRLQRQRKVHGRLGFPFGDRHRYASFVISEEQNSPRRFCVVLLQADIAGESEGFGENIAFMKISDAQKT